MLSTNAARERAFALVERALRAGADAADAVYSGEVAEGVQVRLGQLEEVERSEDEHIGLRVFTGKSSRLRFITFIKCFFHVYGIHSIGTFLMRGFLPLDGDKK